MRRSALLHHLLLLLIPITVLCGAIQWWVRPSAWLHFLLVLLAAGTAAVALLINRLGAFRGAALLTCALPSLGSFASLWITPMEFIAFAYPAVGVLLATLLVSWRAAAWVGVANVSLLLLLPLVQPAHGYAEVAAAIGFNVFVPILMIAGTWSRDHEEGDRSRALLRSEAAWRSLVEEHPDPITISRDARVVYANAAAVNLYGARQASDLLGRPLKEFTPPRFHREIEERARKIEHGQRTEPTEFQVRRLDGEERWIEAGSVPVQYEESPAALTVIRDVTREREARRLLRESEARYRALVEHAPEAIVVFEEPDHVFVDFNSNAERLFGLDAKGLAGRTPLELSPPNQPCGEPSKDAWRRYTTLAREGGVARFDWAFLSADGREIPCDMSLVRLPSDRGLVIRGSITDISEKKDAERALRASEEQYRVLIETMNDGLVAVDSERTITFVNRRFREIFGADCDMIGVSLSELVDPDARGVLERQARLREAGVSEPYEARALRLDGVPIHVRVTPSIIRDEQGRYAGSFGLVRDITETKRTERERQLAEARIRSIVEHSSDVITVLDESGRIVFESPSVETMLGYTPDQLLGLHVTEFIHPDDVGSTMAALEAGANHRGRAQRVEIRLRHRDGSWKVVEAVGQVLESSLGNWQIVVHSRDITERLRLEEAVIGISGREQRRFGQDLHDGMGQVLVAARLYAEGLVRKLARRGAPEAEGVREIGRMLDEAHAQARGLARGLSPVSLEEGGLEAALQGLADSIQQLHGIECLVDTMDTVALQDIDVATHVYRIAQEAMTNAARHARPTRITLALARHAHTVLLTVHDDGEGMHFARSRNQGMGIRIMEHRAGMLGGSLRIVSDGAGTLVTCSFPSQAPHSAAPAPRRVFE